VRECHPTLKLDLPKVAPRKEVMRRVFLVPLAIAAVMALVSGLWLGATSGKTAAAGTRLGPNYGVSLDLPSAWIGYIYDGNRGALPPRAILQATSFTGAGPDALTLQDDAAARVGELMGPRDILILLWEWEGGGGDTYVPLVGAPEITRKDFSPIEGFAHPVARTLFTTQGRFFDLMVEFGGEFGTTPDSTQMNEANEVLATLRVEQRS
jgi:hypothetical protein